MICSTLGSGWSNMDKILPECLFQWKDQTKHRAGQLLFQWTLAQSRSSHLSQHTPRCLSCFFVGAFTLKEWGLKNKGYDKGSKSFSDT